MDFGNGYDHMRLHLFGVYGRPPTDDAVSSLTALYRDAGVDKNRDTKTKPDEIASSSSSSRREGDEHKAEPRYASENPYDRPLVEHGHFLDGVDKHFACGLCGKALKTREALDKHAYIHSGVKKPFACDACDKSFFQRSQLDTHRVVHSGSKPFACGKSLGTKEGLDKHAYVHTKRKKPHACDACDKSFFQRSQLESHRVAHTGVKPYACATCSKSFKTREGLEKHAYMHTKEKKPHACDACDKSFFQRSQLDAHKVRHRDKRFFVCDMYGNSFKLKKNTGK